MPRPRPPVPDIPSASAGSTVHSGSASARPRMSVAFSAPPPMTTTSRIAVTGNANARRFLATASTVKAVSVANPSRALFPVCASRSRNPTTNAGLKVSRPVDFGGGRRMKGCCKSSSSSCGTGIPAAASRPPASYPQSARPAVRTNSSRRTFAGPVSKPVTALASVPAGSTVTLAIPPKLRITRPLPGWENRM